MYPSALTNAGPPRFPANSSVVNLLLRQQRRWFGSSALVLQPQVRSITPFGLKRCRYESERLKVMLFEQKRLTVPKKTKSANEIGC